MGAGAGAGAGAGVCARASPRARVFLALTIALSVASLLVGAGVLAYFLASRAIVLQTNQLLPAHVTAEALRRANLQEDGVLRVVAGDLVADAVHAAVRGGARLIYADGGVEGLAQLVPAQMLNGLFSWDFPGMAAAAIAFDPVVQTLLQFMHLNSGMLTQALDDWTMAKAVLSKVTALNKNPCVPQPLCGVFDLLAPDPIDYLQVNGGSSATVAALGSEVAQLAGQVASVQWPQFLAGVGIQPIAIGVQSIGQSVAGVSYPAIQPATCPSQCPVGQQMCSTGQCVPLGQRCPCSAAQATCSDGSCAASVSACAAPTLVISSVSPSSVLATGSGSVTLTITGQASSGLSLAGAVATLDVAKSTSASVSMSGSTFTVVAVFPTPSSSGLVTVGVQLGSTASAFQFGAVTLVLPPSIKSVSPSSGPAAGNTLVTLSGFNLPQSLAGVSVTVAGSPAVCVYASLTTWYCYTGTATASAGPATMTTSLGSFTSGSATFQYLQPLSANSMTPQSITNAAGSTLTITLSGAVGSGTVVVVIGQNLVSSSVSVSGNSIVATFPANFLSGTFPVTIVSAQFGSISVPGTVSIINASPSLQSIAFSPSLSSLTATFSAPLAVNYAGASCGSYFTNGNTIFGASSVCYVYGRTVSIQLSPDCTVTAGTFVMVSSGLQGAGNAAATGSATVMAPAANSLAGVVSLSSSQVCACCSLIARGQLFTGAGVRTPTVAWSVSPSMPFTTLTGSAGISIASAALQAAATKPYTVTVSATVTNFVGQTLTVSSTATVLGTQFVPVQFLGGAVQTATVATGLTLFGSAALPPCVTPTSIAYSWALPSGVSAFTTTQPFLYLPPYTVSLTSPAGAQLTFTLTVTATLSDGSTLTSTGSVQVNYVPVPPVALIAGGGGVITLPSSGGVVQSASFNLNSQQALTNAWSCANTLGTACPPGTFSDATVSAPTVSGLPAGTYVLTLTVTDGATGTSSTTTATMAIVTSTTLLVPVITLGSSTVTNAAGGVVTNRPLAMYVSVPGATMTSAWTFAWTSTPSGVLTSSANLLSGTSGPVLVLAGGVLASGATYEFSVSVTNGAGQSGSATIGVTTAAQPSVSASDCTLSTTTATAGVTQVTVTCSAQSNGGAGGVSYLYSQVSGGSTTPLSEPSPSGSATIVLQAAGSVSILVTVTDVYGSSATVSVGSVTVTLPALSAISSLTDSAATFLQSGQLSNAVASVAAAAATIGTSGSSSELTSLLGVMSTLMSSAGLSQSGFAHRSQTLAALCSDSSASSSVLTSCATLAVQGSQLATQTGVAAQMTVAVAQQYFSIVAALLRGQSRSADAGRSASTSALATYSNTVGGTVSSMVCGQNSQTLQASNSSTLTTVVYKGSSSSVLSGASGAVSTTSDVASAIGVSSGTCVGVGVGTWSANPAGALSGVNSYVVSVAFYSSTGSALTLPTALGSTEFTVLVPLTGGATSGTCQASVDGTTWSASGCTTGAVSNGKLTCTCSRAAYYASTTPTTPGVVDAMTLGIALGVVGGVVVIVLIVVVACCCCRRRVDRKRGTARLQVALQTDTTVNPMYRPPQTVGASPAYAPQQQQQQQQPPPQYVQMQMQQPPPPQPGVLYMPLTGQ